MTVSAVINEFNNTMSTKRSNRKRLKEWEYSTDQSLDSNEEDDEFSHLSRTITPVELENCINKMRSNLKTLKSQKGRRGSIINHENAKENLIPTDIRRNNGNKQLGEKIIYINCVGIKKNTFIQIIYNDITPNYCSIRFTNSTPVLFEDNKYQGN